MKQLITNVYVITMDKQNRVYKKGYLLIEDDLILAIGSMSDPLPNADHIIDGKGGILLPGMINTHTHTGMIPFRSLGDDVPDRLRRFLFPLEKKLTKEFVYHSARYAIAEMFLSGITCFSDMYYFEEEVAKATDELHARGFLGETIINQPVCDYDNPFDALCGTEKFIKKWSNHPRVTPMIAPHAPNTNDEISLLETKRLADKYNVPIMMHVAEMTYEMEYFQEHYETTPVRYLEKLGLFNTRFILAHGIFLDEKDQQILSNNRSRVGISHCIGANTKSAKGVAPIKQLISKGLSIGLGTDGPSSGNTLDMFTQMKMVGNFHKTKEADRSLFPAKEIVRMATIGGAEVLGIEDRVGTLEVGKQADIVLIETKSVNMFPIYDPYAVLVYSANASNVESVWIDGYQVVEDKNLVDESLERLREKLSEQMVEFVAEAKKIADYSTND